MGIFSKFGFGLKKTREGMTGRIEDVLGAYEEITDDFFDDLEEALIMGDIGMKTATDIVSELRKRVNKNEVRNPKHAKMIISDIIAEMIDGGEDILTDPWGTDYKIELRNNGKRFVNECEARDTLAKARRAGLRVLIYPCSRGPLEGISQYEATSCTSVSDSGHASRRRPAFSRGESVMPLLFPELEGWGKVSAVSAEDSADMGSSSDNTSKKG